MNNRKIEKLLKEKADELPICDFELNNNELSPHELIVKYNYKSKKRVLQTAVIAAAIVIISFSISISANAKFRDRVVSFGTNANVEIKEMIISFFKSSKTEVLPTTKFTSTGTSVVPTSPSITPTSTNGGTANYIKFIGRQSIDEIADISYYEFEGGLSLWNDIASVAMHDGSYKYYKLIDGEISEIQFEHITVNDIIEYNGLSYPFNYEIGTLDGRPYFRRINTMGSDRGATYCGKYSDKLVWLNLSERAEGGHVVLYNMETGEITDILKGLLPENNVIRSTVFSPDKTKIILADYAAGSPGKCYYFDAITKTMSTVEELTGLENVYICSFINDNSLSVIRYTNDPPKVNPLESDYILSAYNFNIETKEIITIYEDRRGDSGYVWLGMEGGYSIDIVDNKILLYTPKGEKYFIEGLDSVATYSFMINLNRTKMCIWNTSDATSDSLKISELGIIDLEKLELKIFGRKDFEQKKETSIGWADNNTITITAENENQYLYVYKFK